MIKKIQFNKKNETTFHLRTDSKKFELLHNDAKANNKSLNLFLNEVIDEYYKYKPQQ
ncbi:hypothetical protein [Methylovorus glucosotrophus]|uniref:Uncharacterized protein n=1 Tax=Methylovorus glucosotrophus (strain SIP3-4) TaxID=582744 RepID=C6X7Y4_METGS|nr:hypothetical protein [Methylovorus glucosotrophus]ACT51311.1 hypothetical protein Msip34_2069 [Methylovorus glucosotrophus SIP3-4]